MGYSNVALAKSGARISILRASANGRSSEASFFTPKFYDGLFRGASAHRPRSGNANSVKPVTLFLSINGGSSPKLNENTTMSNIYDLSLRLSQPEMEALETLLLGFLESNLSDFTHGNELLAMRLRKALEAVIEAINELGGVQ